MTDLTTATTEELLDELMPRNTCAVFVGRPKVNRDFRWQTRSVGPIHENIGLCGLVMHSLAELATAGE